MFHKNFYFCQNQLSLCQQTFIISISKFTANTDKKHLVYSLYELHRLGHLSFVVTVLGADGKYGGSFPQKKLSCLLLKSL